MRFIQIIYLEVIFTKVKNMLKLSYNSGQLFIMLLIILILYPPLGLGVLVITIYLMNFRPDHHPYRQVLELLIMVISLGVIMLFFSF